MKPHIFWIKNPPKPFKPEEEYTYFKEYRNNIAANINLKFRIRRLLDNGHSKILMACLERYRQRKMKIKTLRDHLILRNIRLARSEANNFSNSNYGQSDITMDSMCGLIEAVDRFDPDRNCRFSSYALHWIRQSILRALFNNANPIRIPEHIANKIFYINRETRKYNNAHGRDPDTMELSSITNMPPAEIKDILELVHNINTVSTCDERDSVIDKTIHKIYTKQQVKLMLECLDDREKEILFRSFINSETLEDIGDSMDVSRERIRQLKKIGEDKIKNKFAESEDTIEL